MPPITGMILIGNGKLVHTYIFFQINVRPQSGARTIRDFVKIKVYYLTESHIMPECAVSTKKLPKKFK